jgi:hypothetical protein
MEENAKAYEEKIQILKKEHLADMAEGYERLRQEKQTLEEKLDLKRKQHREAESSLTK